MSSTLAIDARGVTKRFGAGDLAVEALRGVDLQVERGEFIMLVGPSGSGKTTLLSILGCVLSPTHGEVSLLGERVSDLSERELPAFRRSFIGFIFQGYNLIDALSAHDNVATALRIRGADRVRANDEASRVLERVGLAGRVRNKPSQLSGGEMQRVAIARALAGRPPLVLADEPTASLDATSGRKVTEMLREISEEQHATVLVVTHDSRIFELSQRVVRIEDGRIEKQERAGRDG
jgi:putative ABC transport system ATP-binding protein